MNNYIQRFILGAQAAGYDKEYIDLCIAYANRLISNQLPVIFDPDHLAAIVGLEPKYLLKLFYLCNSSDKLYKELIIPKKSGGIRKISIPIEGLKFLQRWVLENILDPIQVSSSSMGFVKKKSIVDNALRHVNKECVINYDIKDYFPTIRRNHIFKIFKYYGYTNEVSYLLSKICTHKDSLPQGAPTSPYLSNIHCLRLDKRLEELASRINADYTRYADDITLSGNSNVVKYRKIVIKIIESEGFEINAKKTRFQSDSQRQMVTGLVVNKKVTVPVKRKRYLRQQIYYCKKYGVSNHMKYSNINKSNFKQYLYGLAYFVKMVERDKGEQFISQLNEITWDY